MTILVDSDVVIDLLRARDPEIISIWEAHLERSEIVACSVITVMEVEHGIRPTERRRAELVLSSLTRLPVGEEIANRAGQFLRQYRPSHGLGVADALIAATAAVHQHPLWTRNRKHYPMKELHLL